jgi:hypothetical protein
MMKKKLDGVQVWKQVEELAVPRLQLSVIDRAVYLYLLRKSRLEGKGRLRFSIDWLAQGACVSTGSARKSVRRLVDKGALRLTERSRAGHEAEVRLPEEIRGVRAGKVAVEGAAARAAIAGNFEEADFVENRGLREAIHLREGGWCFYCMRRLTRKVRCLDHVIPLARKRRNSYRNLVSACMKCNALKGERRAEDFVRRLYREGRLTGAELSGRLRALGRLTSGKLRPRLPSPRTTLNRRSNVKV